MAEERNLRLKGYLIFIAIFFLICYIEGCNSKKEQQYSNPQSPPHKTSQQSPSRVIEKSAEPNESQETIELTPTVSSEVTRKITKEYPDNKPQEIIYYSDGKEIAKETFDKEGNVEIVGKIPDGIVKEYYDSGELKAEWNYKNNKRDGESRIYYKNWILQRETNYKDGRLDGITKLYYEGGQLQGEYTYKDGKLKGIKIESTLTQQFSENVGSSSPTGSNDVYNEKIRKAQEVVKAFGGKEDVREVLINIEMAAKDANVSYEEMADYMMKMGERYGHYGLTTEKEVQILRSLTAAGYSGRRAMEMHSEVWAGLQSALEKLQQSENNENKRK